MGAQIRLEHLFADDRSDPLFSSHLTMSQLKILLLLSRHGTLAGGELARMLGGQSDAARKHAEALLR
jgi:DNA-binding MarR family transcriptional regulator